VIQFKEPAGSAPPPIFNRSQKSLVPSIDRNGNLDGFTTATGAAATGWSWFPGYAIDLDRGVRVHMWIAESEEEDPVLGNDLLWNPDTSANGNRHFVIITNRAYDFGPNGERGAYQDEVDSLFTVPGIQVKDYGKWYARNLTWMLSLRINPFIPVAVADRDKIRIKLRVEKDYSDLVNGQSPIYTFSSRGMGARNEDGAQAQKDLELIRVVPNPYYAYSQYETSQVDKRVKITNLPPKCTVSIFTLSGSLVRQFKRNIAEDIPGQGLTSLEWELTNQDGLPVGSGVYIIHIDAEELGEKVVKFFNITRPIDLDTF